MSVGLEGRGIVVTGGGSGIGAATCRLLALKGATVGVLDRNADAARAVAEEIGGWPWPATSAPATRSTPRSPGPTPSSAV